MALGAALSDKTDRVYKENLKFAYFDQTNDPSSYEENSLTILDMPNGNIEAGEYLIDTLKLNLSLGIVTLDEYLDYYDGSTPEKTDEFKENIERFK